MPRFSQTSRCATCGKEISQAGPARQWVHENEFYAKVDHPAQPAGRPYLMPKRAPEPVAVKRENSAQPITEAGRPRSVAELRRRLQQGSAEIAPDDSASRRRRIAAIDSATPDPGLSEAELAARRLRMMRQAAEDERRR